MSTKSAITFRDLTFEWPDGTVAVSGVNGTFSTGRTGLIGRNGAGKSTLLRLIAGILRPTVGQIDTIGEVGYLPQTLTLRQEATLAELLGIDGIIAAMRAIESGDVDERHFDTIGDDWDIESRADEALHQIGFTAGDLDRRVAEVSGGEAMLIAITGLRLRRTPITLLDEPTNNLDRPTRAKLADFVDQWPGTLVVVSHDLELLEHVENTTELYGGILDTFGGPYSAWKKYQGQEQAAAVQAARSAQQALKVEKRQRVEAETKLARREGREGSMESLVSTVVGRDGVHGELSAFMTATGGRALILRGETGVGKSALLDHVAGLAATENHRVIRAAGVEAEAELPFAGLHQVLYSLLPHAAGLDEGHRAVFDVVFGLREGKAPSVMSVGIAALDLLSLVASEKPLVLLLDDGQWMDASSSEVCGFVGRRLTGSSVKMLIAVRSDVGSRFDTAALPELPVAALSEEAAGQLLDMRHPQLDTQTRHIVLEHAMGNPLALLELPTYLNGGHTGRTAEELLGLGNIPLSRRLQHVYGIRIERLPGPVREELLRGALDGVGAGPGDNRAPGARYRMREADEAVAAGLLDTDPTTGDLVFRHPLIRTTVVQLATPNQRRAAHAELARVHRHDVERRARHLAASIVDPDEEVAAALEAAADSASRRGGAV
ncbi:ATP-binding cassette domain-containing protein, partial [Nonomuraea sp. NPDC005983]|uniref:ATP-binding cassette domain-containing protein n=1 Tax=Nonomuraea sp. NPDC005983 TaxID=3155595 RepID=UPI0033B8EAE3